MKAPVLNAQTKTEAIELLKKLNAIEFETRNESDKFGNESVKIVGMDKDFEIIAYVIVELENQI